MNINIKNGNSLELLKEETGEELKGNGAEQKGNTIENKGNTTENIAIFLIPQSNISLFLIHKGNTKKATHAWRCCR